ncbi:proprotein convertase subtilisin/kexin type 5b isoform X2 [Megalobrama amblycephala]|uniref:proprotein convertase subtilisin/kexin type 5b isoform X2 n=1 Tax=Megalobrama amblycephala TaxID=75352 RepID=UPI002014796F|nr:proprotein convertase subtilisin/kexin type 5b isoform X2 [Megalobrama amblycephala]
MVLNSLPCVLVSLCLVFFSSSPCKARIYTNHWAVRIAGGPEQAEHIANKYGYRNLGQIGDLKDYYHFFHSRTIKRSTLFSRGTHSFISMEPKVEWVQQQVVKRRIKRDYKPSYPGPVQSSMVQSNSIYFNDAKWSSMWYIHCNDNIHNCQSDMNIVGAWKRGYTGKDVVVTILDDGIERNHPDLIQNYDNEASYDVNGNDMDPMPRYDASNENKHGTRCAGEVAASANNSHCTVGIAYNAKIGGVRMLDGDVTDMVEAKSLSLHPQHIDIYSASWGPDDDGKTVDGPASLARQAFENGIRLGRKGRGSIFVWASGNGGRSRDHCSCDGYTNSIYTISISSTAESGRKPWYLEECSSTLTTTYSSGENYDRKIITTDLRQRCTDSHTGTSASAPMAAGIIALALEANPFLTWRDVQHIIVKTSRAGHLSAPDWKTNAAGYNVSHLYGFGLMDAEAMVKEAERWKQVPSQHICVENADKQIRTIRPEHVVRSVYKATGCTDNANHHVIYLEHVVVRITITHPRRGDLSINLTSPSGTKSQLLANRLFDHSMEGFKNWEFMTTHCWGEKAAGDWILEIYDSPSQLRSQKAPGKLKEWSLVLYGTSVHPYSFRSDKPRSVVESQTEDEYSEEYVGSCHPECGENGCEGPGPQQCITCLHYFLKFKNNTRTCVPECPSGFFRDDKKRCKKCSPLCESCVGSRSDQCSTCRPGLYLVEGANNCVSSCPDGFYLDLESTMCRKCSENCKKCTSANICTECQTGLSLQGNKCQLSCEPGTYYNGHRRACEKCHPTCATCAGTGMEACNECAPGYYFEEWRCVSSCNMGYYLAEQTTDNGDVQKSCQKCDPTCYACAGPGERNCSTCVNGYNLENGVCVVSTICKDGEYLSKHNKCSLCDSTCYKCTGPESHDCISCSATWLFDNGQCVLGCDPGKYERDGQCHLCHHTCHECSDEGPKKCTRCSKDKFGVERYLFEEECLVSCPGGCFHSLKGTCDPCPSNCTVCTSTGHCLYCAPSYYPKDGMCAKLECGVGEVADLDHEDCVTCEEGCQHCLVVNPEHCMSCLPDYYELRSSCHKTCPERTFEDKLSMKCARCDDDCLTCDASECYLCEEGFFLSDGMCVKSCKEGFYGDEKQECEPCHHMCRTCGGPEFDDCDSCEDDMFLEKGRCISKSYIKCPDGKFLNGQGECEQCHSSCRTCSGNDKEQCDSCEKGMFLTNSQMCVSVCPLETHGNQTSGRCEDCSAGCLTCLDAHQCLKCKYAFGPLYLQDGKCVPECKRGYPEADRCHSCAIGCATCEGEANNCLSCEKDYLRLKNRCVQHCPPRHFVKGGVCELCPSGCAECDHTGKCSECEQYFFLHKDQCIVDCPKGYFTNVEQKQCMSCHGNCATCDGPDEDDCTTCGPFGLIHYNGKCVFRCPSETYHDGAECRDCDKSCLTCSGPHPSSCLTCRANMRIDVNGHCQFFSDCSPSTFMGEDGQCQPCHKSCLRCSGAGKEQCLSCNSKHFLLNQTCVSTCPDGYYADEEKQECIQCHMSCASCHGHHSNDCVTCNSGLLLLGHSCFPSCPPSFFVNASSRACQACDHTCDECQGSSSFCFSCREGYYLLKKSGQCVHTCPSNYFLHSLDRECKRCHPSCKTCKGSGPIFCTSCYDGYKMYGGICSSTCLSGEYPIPVNDECTTCDPSCAECKGPGPYNCIRCPVLQRLSEDGRCLPCCGDDTFVDSSRIHSECCQCQELNDECIIALNYNLFTNDAATLGHPGLVAFTFIIVLVCLWLVIFLFLHFRKRMTIKPIVKLNGYSKIADSPFTTATLNDSLQTEYSDKDEDQEEDEDIVYMGRDGIVYRKFKYSLLEGAEEEVEVELEYDDEMHIIT